MLSFMGDGLVGAAGVTTFFSISCPIALMIGATLQHVPNGWLLSSASGGYESPALWTVLLVVQALLGRDAYALCPDQCRVRALAHAV